MTAIVSLIMGSQSDWEVFQHAALTLKRLQIPFETKILSAHRTPDAVAKYAETARERGLKVIIAAAGGAAHLAGVIAGQTTLPVLGVPMQSALNGLDSLLSIVQMPAGIPVATFAIGKAGSINAALFAAAMLADGQPKIGEALDQFRAEQSAAVLSQPEPECQ